VREPEKEIEEEIEKDSIEEGEKVLFVSLKEEVWRREELNIRSRSKDSRGVEEDIPREYEDFNNQVFNKAIFEKLPD